MMTKDEYIHLIAAASKTDRHELLVDLMTRYGARNLQQITFEQAKEFYEELIERVKK